MDLIVNAALGFSVELSMEFLPMVVQTQETVSRGVRETRLLSCPSI